jgi:hypothetical protein
MHDQAPATETTTFVVPVAMHRTQLRDFLKSRGGRFVSVEFTKVDGTARRLTGRTGVYAHCKGGRNNVESMARPYITMFDSEAMGYRTVNLATVSSVKADRNVYRIVD